MNATLQVVIEPQITHQRVSMRNNLVLILVVKFNDRGTDAYTGVPSLGPASDNARMEELKDKNLFLRLRECFVEITTAFRVM